MSSKRDIKLSEFDVEIWQMMLDSPQFDKTFRSHRTSDSIYNGLVANIAKRMDISIEEVHAAISRVEDKLFPDIILDSNGKVIRPKKKKAEWASKR